VPTLLRNRPGHDIAGDIALNVARGRPVLLATLDVPFDQEAAAVAVDAAVECGQKLIVANVVEIPLGPLCLNMGYGPLELEDAVQESIKAPAELAHQLGVEVERLRIRSPHPVSALLEFVAERQPGLLVFGPDRTQLKPRIFRKVAKKILERVACLVWLSG
jgi:nucleotide-binding universal stress UspA family protein